ncbi:MAG: sensor histidine kinase [Proteobacteria bacterium]|nr:sensor histidine kinase [Pseudomonadota bacterium]MBU1386584.1 sensor histidine kinase [Pseudomonadota bacterium]MBU1542485.1 sensor histidine kinase [Pseudomonadota bacterium]MBU2483004.1 sensor histidine kinase [Pseudomonadota bacterium]
MVKSRIFFQAGDSDAYAIRSLKYKNAFTAGQTQYKNEFDEMSRIQKELEKIVHQRTIQLKRLNDHLIYTEENERKAIASDLHDSVTQTLAISISKIKNMKESGMEISSANLDEIQGNLEQAIREIRSLIYQLSPPVLDDFDIDIALGFLIEQINLQHHSEFEYTNLTDRAIPLPQGLKITLYRAVSELITNILKHSGTNTGKIVISMKSDVLRITVEDTGKGFDMEAVKNSEIVGFGLNRLSERVENFYGKISVNSSPGAGTKITLTVPI